MGDMSLNLAIRCLVMYTVSRVLLKGDAASGRIEDREFGVKKNGSHMSSQ